MLIKQVHECQEGKRDLKISRQDQEDSVWLLLGARGGDNAQVRAIASHLDLLKIEKPLSYNVLHIFPNLLKGASLGSLRARLHPEIQPPWPRMVIAVGKRSVPVARYIKQQSGGATRLVHLGRPRANLESFDLVLTTPQYGLLAAEQVMELFVPPSALSNLDVVKALEAGAQFRTEKSQPYIVVIVGGNNTTATLSDTAVRNLVQSTQQRTTDTGGSLFVLTSPRTPKAAVEVLRNELNSKATLVEWGQPVKDTANPYSALLAMADEVIVTSDSASMIADGLALNKPVKIFQLPKGWQGALTMGISSLFMNLDHVSRRKGGMILLLAPWRILRKYGLINPPRNMALLINHLFENGLAQPFPPPEKGLPKRAINPVIPTSIEHAITRIKSLLKR